MLYLHTLHMYVFVFLSILIRLESIDMNVTK